MMSTTVWLIERKINNRAHWWSRAEWTTDAAMAVWFVRKVDAADVLAFMSFQHECYLTEHLFVNVENEDARDCPPTIERLETELKVARSINHWQELTRSISHLKKDLEASDKELLESRQQLGDALAHSKRVETDLVELQKDRAFNKKAFEFLKGQEKATAQLQVAREALKWIETVNDCIDMRRLERRTVIGMVYELRGKAKATLAEMDKISGR